MNIRKDKKKLNRRSVQMHLQRLKAETDLAFEKIRIHLAQPGHLHDEKFAEASLNLAMASTALFHAIRALNIRVIEQ